MRLEWIGLNDIRLLDGRGKKISQSSLLIQSSLFGGWKTQLQSANLQTPIFFRHPADRSQRVEISSGN